MNNIMIEERFRLNRPKKSSLKPITKSKRNVKTKTYTIRKVTHDDVNTIIKNHIKRDSNSKVIGGGNV